MALSSPFIAKSNSVQGIMLRVLAALCPAILAYAWFFGPAILVNVLLASVTALAAEAFMLRMRRYPVQIFVFDGSALLTAWLLALSIPSTAPWWMIIVGTAFAIIIAKHLYGGLGNNLFNPAMVGFAVLMISFPAIITQWPAPASLTQAGLSSGDQIQYVFTRALPAGLQLDAVNMATPLDTLKTQLKLEKTVQDVMKQPIFGPLGGVGTGIIALLYLVGGIYLLMARIITWHIPVGVLGAVAVLSGVFYLYDPTHYASPVFHLLAGATMLGAFFIATDYVTSPQTPRGKLIYGATVGALVYIIRVWGGYPDGVAFAVLIMNCAVPLIDVYTPPPVFGHKKKALQ